MRQRKNNTFMLAVEETLVKPEMLGTYPIEVQLFDEHTKVPRLYFFDLVLAQEVKN
jgi:hypothetical protein